MFRDMGCNETTDAGQSRLYGVDPQFRERVGPLGVQRKDSNDTTAARGRSSAGEGLFSRGGWEIHLLQEGLEAGVGAEGVERGPRVEDDQPTVALLSGRLQP